MDNQGAMNMASNWVTNKRSKPIDLRYHLLMDFTNKGMMKLEYMNTNHNVDDKGITKHL